MKDKIFTLYPPIYLSTTTTTTNNNNYNNNASTIHDELTIEEEILYEQQLDQLAIVSHQQTMDLTCQWKEIQEEAGFVL